MYMTQGFFYNLNKHYDSAYSSRMNNMEHVIIWMIQGWSYIKSLKDSFWENIWGWSLKASRTASAYKQQEWKQSAEHIIHECILSVYRWLLRHAAT